MGKKKEITHPRECPGSNLASSLESVKEEQRRKIKVVVFGSRHTGQGPLGRAWGRTDADLPDLQPVVIYEREISHAGITVIVAAWILSLDPQFEYMRKAMFMHADAFIYTFDVSDITGKTLQYLDPFIDEVHGMYEKMPPELLIGSVYDPTLSTKPAKTTKLVEAWREQHNNPPYFEIDLTNKAQFFDTAEKVFQKAVYLFAENVGKKN
nr:hypothetical protein [Candidatus Sigynarchaeota archaeon]